MSLLDRVRDTYLRIDARSLGLFRIAMGLALIGDWWTRWGDVRAFYSNEGVLSNHAHLHTILKQDAPARVWSVLHAFSTPGENRVALLLILLVYVLFTIGLHARVFHVLSLAMLVSLTGRNLLLETPSNSVALALLAATAFLPTGSRFSVDSLRDSFRRDREKDAAALNRRAPPGEAVIAAARAPGWSPTSLAALAVHLHLAIVLFAVWRQQTGPAWQDGTALHYALWVERSASDLGVWLRGAPPALLSGWSALLHLAPAAIPVLLFVPLPRYARPAATAMLLVYGLSYGLLFHLGLWGWTFVAAAFLVISTETWDAYQSRFRKGRALTVIYDADCGICLWLTRLLKRLDLRGQLTFQGNDLLTTPPEPPAGNPGEPYRAPADGEEPPRFLYRRLKAGASVEAVRLPSAITDDLVTGTVVAVDETGKVLTEGRAIAAITRSLPLGGLLSLPLRIPGITSLLDILYRLIPPRRFAISEALGMGACGLTRPAEQAPSGESAAPEVAPAVRLRRLFTGAVREVLAIALLAAVLAQAARENPWPAALTIPQPRALAAIAGWPRLVSRYDVFAPEPSKEDGVLVVDAQTRSGRAIDPMTGEEPAFQSTRFRLGPLWAAYLAGARKKDAADAQKTLREYLVKGGRAWSNDISENQITGLDAYWLVYRSPAPGGRAPELVGREKLFSHSRGGRSRTEVPVLQPTPNR